MRRMFLANHLNKDKDGDANVDRDTVENTKAELKKSMKHLYDISDSEEDEG